MDGPYTENTYEVPVWLGLEFELFLFNTLHHQVPTCAQHGQTAHQLRNGNSRSCHCFADLLEKVGFLRESLSLCILLWKKS